MKTWAYDFPPTSKADWLQQIERDLKGKPLSSLHQSWWPGAPLDPIHHADDHAPLVKLPDYLFTQPPAIIENIYATGLTSAQLNTELRDALQFGAQQINLSIDEPLFTQHGEWLNGIYTDMVTWYLMSADVSALSKNNFAANAPDRVYQVIRRNPAVPAEMWIRETDDQKIKTRWVYTIDPGGDWLDACANTFQLLLQDAQLRKTLSGNDDHLNQSELHIEAATDYLQCLIQLRTLHVLWQNMASHRASSGDKLNTNPYLICQVKPITGELPDAYVVRATTSAVAAFLAGVSGLCISSIDGSPNYYRRINRNVQHLLHMESGLPRQTDPMAGAYAIDHYTAGWASAIWEKLDKA